MTGPATSDVAPTSDTATCDVAIVGAGPAGSAAALAVLATDPRLKVVLIDRADFPRDKCCGDGIAPHVLDVLAKVGVAGLTGGWTPVERLSLSRGGHRVEGRMSRPAWVIPREVFDARLVERALDAGASLIRARVSKIEAWRDGLILDGRIAARIVIGADGVHSNVRAAVGLSATAPRAFALRGYAPTDAARRGLQVIRYGERRQPSYAWAFDRGDGWSNVGYGELTTTSDHPGEQGLSRALLLEQLDHLLPGTVAEGEQWRGHHLPLSGWRWEQPDGPILLAGDAAGLVNPMTGEGIYYAVATGVCAGRTAALALGRGEPHQAGAHHRGSVRHLLAWHLRHTWTAAHLSRTPALVDAGIIAAGRRPKVFDDLVEMGLGRGRITPRLVAGLSVALVTSPRSAQMHDHR